MPPRPKRKYQPIWEELKRAGKCRITIHSAFHPRVIRMVQKEKNEDLEYKYIQGEQDRRNLLSVKISGNILAFTLEKSITAEDL